MTNLTPEQIAVIEAHRADGQRQVVAARAAGVSTWAVSQWCRTVGKPWPRGSSERRAIRDSADEPVPATRAEALALTELELVEISRSTSPAMRQFAADSLRKLRDHRVTTEPKSSTNTDPSGDRIRKSEGASDA